MSAVAFVNAQTLKIELRNSTPDEVQTKAQLLRLVSKYDVSKWIFTDKISVERGIIPHSHPVLTLSTRHVKDDELLLSTFLHEEFHWYLVTKPGETTAMVTELKTMFPEAPVGGKEGANDEESTYNHIIVCALEYSALRLCVGELVGQQVMDFWKRDHYTWIYETVVSHSREIYDLMRKHSLLPLPATPTR